MTSRKALSKHDEEPRCLPVNLVLLGIVGGMRQKTLIYKQRKKAIHGITALPAIVRYIFSAESSKRRECGGEEILYFIAAGTAVCNENY
ncbi:MAG: hypothetical protein V7K24_15515 [Nostoc sp.]